VQCPVCSTEMVARETSGVVLQQCNRCPSIWLGDAERRALARTQSGSWVQEHGKFVEARPAATLPCPTCEGGRLQRGSIEGQSVMQCTVCKGILLEFRPGAADEFVAV